MPNQPDLLWTVADRLGSMALLLGIIWAIYKRWLVPGWALEDMHKRYDEIKVDKEHYRAIAERTLGTADRAVRVAETTVEQVKQP